MRAKAVWLAGLVSAVILLLGVRASPIQSRRRNGLIDARRAELLAEATPIAERVFSEKRAFVARLHGYWAARDGLRRHGGTLTT